MLQQQRSAERGKIGSRRRSQECCGARAHPGEPRAPAFCVVRTVMSRPAGVVLGVTASYRIDKIGGFSGFNSRDLERMMDVAN